MKTKWIKTAERLPRKNQCIVVSWKSCVGIRHYELIESQVLYMHIKQTDKGKQLVFGGAPCDYWSPFRPLRKGK